MALRSQLAAAVVLGLILAAPADALTVRQTKEVEHSFTGAACGSTSGALVTLPRAARAPQIVRPALDDVLASDDDDVTPVATITVAETGPLGGTQVASFQAAGSDDVCTNPGNYTADGWATVDVDLVVQFTLTVRTYVRGLGSRARRRPARLNLGIGTLTSLSWQSWNGRVARGSGLGPGALPVSVRLSRPRQCAGSRWHYLTARYRYVAQVPEGARRRRTVRLDSTC